MRTIHFGAAGWRARRDGGFDTGAVAAVAAAMGLAWGSRFEGARILVGFDTRHDSEEQALMVARILSSYGLEALLSETPVCAPALEWSVAQDTGAVGGVLVSGEDYSSDYNGILACGADGGSLSRELADEIDSLIATGPYEAAGSIDRADFLSAYLSELESGVDGGAIRRMHPTIVVDCMHGTACGVAARLFERVGCEVIELRGNPLPNFGNIHPQPIDPWVDECEREVVRSGAAMGVSFGGICRRLAIIDADGHLASPHMLAPILLEHLVMDRNRGGRVVGTVTCSVRLARQAERLGLEYTRVPVGFDWLHSEMAEGDVILASEEYGGVAIPRHLMARDALVATLAVLERMAKAGLGAGGLVWQVEQEVGHMSYKRDSIQLDGARDQYLRNILPGLNPRQLAGMETSLVSHAGGLRMEFDNGAWAMLRLSRQSSLVRTYAEAPTPKQADELLRAVAQIARGGMLE